MVLENSSSIRIDMVGQIGSTETGDISIPKMEWVHGVQSMVNMHYSE